MGKSKPFSGQIRQLVDACGMTRYRLAQLTGIDEATLSRFMSGQRGLSMKALDRLAAVLDLEVTMRRKER